LLNVRKKRKENTVLFAEGVLEIVSPDVHGVLPRAVVLVIDASGLMAVEVTMKPEDGSELSRA
jgi:hypothetical protein